ncbi:MAG TPA: DMT family transporter [Vicinamibacteria bacterium]|nr:DMT family transporter [Vicinamibacteria bacterium]
MIDRRSPYLVLLLAVAFVSVGSVLVRLAQAPPLAVAFYRVTFATLLIAPLAWPDARRSLGSLSSRSRLLLVASGIALALHFATWIASLSYTSIASSVLLVNTAPIFAVILSRLFLHERVSGAVLAAIALAIVGAGLIALGDWGRSPSSLGGNLLAVAGAVTLAAYHVVGRGLRDTLPLYAYVLSVWGIAALTLAVIVRAFGTPFAPYPARTFLVLLTLGLVPTVLGHGLVNRALRSLPAPTVGLFLLGEPIGASILAFFLFHEVPSGSTMLGGLVVLMAMALVLFRRD